MYYTVYEVKMRLMASSHTIAKTLVRKYADQPDPVIVTGSHGIDNKLSVLEQGQYNNSLEPNSYMMGN